MPTIHEIRPSGGGDFTTLAAYEAFADGQASGDQWAECYTGGDLGFVEVSGWTGTINASTYPRIYGASGNRHDGDITAGAYVSDAGGYLSVVSTDFVEVDGIRFSGQGKRVTISDSNSFTLRNCLIEGTSTVTPQALLITFSTSALVFNNIIIGGLYGCQVNANASGAASAELYNNTIYGSGTGIRVSETTNNATCTAKNNIVMGCTSSDFGTSGAVSLTSDYNLISDASLTSLGVKGANDIESATLAAVLTDAANDDFTLVSGSAAIDSGLDLSATIDAFDIAGTARGTWDRGAFAADGPTGSPWYYYAQH